MNKFLPPLIIFVVFMLYFGFQACPTFYYWDSAELTAAVLKDGVPHPPGFPSFLILAKLWLAITPFEPAHGLNIFSSFFAASGLALWFLVITRVLSNSMGIRSKSAIRTIAFLSIAVMGGSFTYGIQATRFEVYSLNFSCFVAMFLLSLNATESNRPSRWLLFALFTIMGLSLGVHNLTIILAIPGIILLLLLGKRVKIKYLVMGLPGAILLAIPLYLTIYSLAKGQPSINWGDPSTPGRFYDYLIGREFTTSVSSFRPAHIIQNLTFALKILSKQFGILGLVLSFWGLLLSLRNMPKIGIPLAAIMIPNVFSLIFAESYFYENYDWHGYLLISLSVAALYMAIAFGVIYGYIRGRLQRGGDSHSHYALVLTSIVMAVVIAIPLQDNLISADLSEATGAGDYAESFLEDAPDDAVILTSYFNTYFCLLAYKATYAPERNLTVLNIYNWDHFWARVQTERLLKISLPINQKRQSFYRNLLNRFSGVRPIYIEYDRASGPVAHYLKPHGLGYLFSPEDPSSAEINLIREDIGSRLRQASSSKHLETVRTWTLWFHNRGQYYDRRGDEKSAAAYYAASDSIASLVELE